MRKCEVTHGSWWAFLGLGRDIQSIPGIFVDTMIAMLV
jgi:hypothetical protein